MEDFLSKSSTPRIFRSVFIFAILIYSTSCSLTAVRPVQEMSNAEVAIKAAKDLNADSLAPELYRKSMDAYYKAKREYKIKNFEDARKFAITATKLAEKAEYKAYTLGGATPEASQKLLPPEGAAHDPETALQEGLPEERPSETTDNEEDEAPTQKKPPSQDDAKGTDYNEYLRQEEKAEKDRLSKPAEKKETN